MRICLASSQGEPRAWRREHQYRSQALGTEGEIGYVVTDVAQRPSQKALDELAAIEGTIRMRVIS